MLENADKTYDYIQKVASFYRYNIATGNESLLSEEIGIVDTYIYILNVRFSGEIKYEKYIEDEKYLNIYMPGMILQPIVENAINHGIRDIAWEGKIELSVCRVDDNICISIADNGVGITKDVIDKILDGTYRETATSDDGKNNGLGMNNVMERLNLYYNGKNGFEIISNGKNQGTEIVITIPYEENGDV